MTTFPQQLREVRKQGQDFEWYPTSSQIITALVQDLKYSISKPHYREENQNSFLDIGAGNGKVIKEVSALENIGRCFAIEKSPVLLDLLPPEVMILGTDFWKTSLIDKSIRVIFSNPPYSEYELWTAKILSEAPTGTRVYLVIPDRWENSAHIQEALRSRKIKPEILGRTGRHGPRSIYSASSSLSTAGMKRPLSQNSSTRRSSIRSRRNSKSLKPNTMSWEQSLPRSKR
jgi:hypothetical protein